MRGEAVKKQQQAARADKRAAAKIGEAGWTIIRRRDAGDARFVGSRHVIEEDHSITKLYESSLTLAGLAKNVDRREREEGNVIGSQANVARQKEQA